VVGSELNTEKNKYMFVSRYPIEFQNWDIKIANRSFENVAQFKYFEKTVRNKNFIQKEIKRRLNMGNACYHLVQNLLFSHMPSRNIQIRIHDHNFACGSAWV
jgi:hypothetical protein